MLGNSHISASAMHELRYVHFFFHTCLRTRGLSGRSVTTLGCQWLTNVRRLHAGSGGFELRRCGAAGPTVRKRTRQPHRRQEARKQALYHVDTHSVAELLTPLGIRHHLLEVVWVHALQSTVLACIEEPTSVGDPDLAAGEQTGALVHLHRATPLAGVDREEPWLLQRLMLVAQELRHRRSPYLGSEGLRRRLHVQQGRLRLTWIQEALHRRAGNGLRPLEPTLDVKVFADADDVEPISALRHAVISGIQDPPLDVIAILSQQLV